MATSSAEQPSSSTARGRLSAASLAVAVLAGAAAGQAALALMRLPTARSASARAWQIEFGRPLVAVAVIYLAVTCWVQLGRGLQASSSARNRWPWLAAVAHLAAAIALGMAIWRGPGSRLLFAGQETLAAAALVVALFSTLLTVFAARLAQPARGGMLESAAALLFTATCLWIETRGLPQGPPLPDDPQATANAPESPTGVATPVSAPAAVPAPIGPGDNGASVLPASAPAS